MSQKGRGILQVGGKGKDEIEEFCTENEQWKEVGFTNSTWAVWMGFKETLISLVSLV